MKLRHAQGIQLHLEAAEANAFSVSTKHGRAWKLAYQNARLQHSIRVSIEIADLAAKGVK